MQDTTDVASSDDATQLLLGRVESLLQELSDLVSGPHGQPLAAVIADRLVGQLADGQVELLRAVDGAGAGVTASASRVGAQVALLERVLGEVRTAVVDVRDAGRDVRLAALEAGTSTGAAVVELLGTELAKAGRDAADDALRVADAAFTELVARTESELRQAGEATAVGVSQAVDPVLAALDGATEQLTREVVRGSQSVITHLRHAEAAVAGVAEDASRRTSEATAGLQEAAARAAETVAASAAALRAAADDVLLALDGRIEAVASMAAAAVADIERVTANRDRREQAAQVRAEKRMAELVARAESQIEEVLSRLAEQVDLLSARDAALESQRAAEFAAVLAGTVSGPLASRRLRRQVVDAVGRAAPAAGAPEEDP